MLCACLCAGLFTAPAFAMQPVASASAAPPVSAGSLPAPASAAVTAPAIAPVATVAPATGKAIVAPAANGKDVHDDLVVLDEPMPMSDRALLLANDINRLIAKPSATASTDADADTSTGGRIQGVLQRALTLLGTPYRWGGTTTDGFDCSGLVGYVFRTTLGIELPRVSRDMAHTGQEVDRASLIPGDLVFFGRKGRVNHVGIYLGDGRFLHAPRTGRDVTVSKLDGYWGRKFLEARRVAANGL
jgi:cell wall-associated NlpC family hydrolase